MNILCIYLNKIYLSSRIETSVSFLLEGTKKRRQGDQVVSSPIKFTILGCRHLIFFFFFLSISQVARDMVSHFSTISSIDKHSLMVHVLYWVQIFTKGPAWNNTSRMWSWVVPNPLIRKSTRAWARGPRRSGTYMFFSQSLKPFKIYHRCCLSKHICFSHKRTSCV